MGWTRHNDPVKASGDHHRPGTDAQRNPRPTTTIMFRFNHMNEMEIYRLDGEGAYREWIYEVRMHDGTTEPHQPDCPWPLHTPEGRAWYEGWNRGCQTDFNEDAERNWKYLT
jgi:hypothetical protein